LKRWTKVTLPVWAPSIPDEALRKRAISSTKMRLHADSASARSAITRRTSSKRPGALPARERDATKEERHDALEVLRRVDLLEGVRDGFFQEAHALILGSREEELTSNQISRRTEHLDGDVAPVVDKHLLRLADEAVRQDAVIVGLHDPHQPEASDAVRSLLALDERLSRLSLRELPAVLDEARDPQRASIERRILDGQGAISVQPVPGIGRARTREPRLNALACALADEAPEVRDTEWADGMMEPAPVDLGPTTH
jgi:hypothetical protein